jgi:hypothetical protein
LLEEFEELTLLLWELKELPPGPADPRRQRRDKVEVAA